MSQARPDDVFAFVTPANIRNERPRLERQLGLTRARWTWLLDRWEEVGPVDREAWFVPVTIPTVPAFVRLSVARGDESVIVDLAAEPGAVVEPPLEVDLGGTMIQVDTPHEILVNRLCARLERSELFDLVDFDALPKAGGDLRSALGAAPAKDAGFSAPTLARILQNLALRPMAVSAGLSLQEQQEVEGIRSRLVDAVL